MPYNGYQVINMRPEIQTHRLDFCRQITLPLNARSFFWLDYVHLFLCCSQGGGVMDASILLKPILARGELRCIGCTSLDKFRKFIEKDPALERRFVFHLDMYQRDSSSLGEFHSVFRCFELAKPELRLRQESPEYRQIVALLSVHVQLGVPSILTG